MVHAQYLDEANGSSGTTHQKLWRLGDYCKRVRFCVRTAARLCFCCVLARIRDSLSGCRRTDTLFTHLWLCSWS
jgi:hypothetical protein